MRDIVKNLDYYKSKFILKANNTHNNKYDYSKVIYINSIEKVEVICPLHGSFFVRPDAHVRKVGCPSCNGGIKYTSDKFIEKASTIHSNKYDYSKVEYINSTKKVEIICRDHGSFFMSPANHLIRQGCPSCSGVKRKTSEEFISISNRIHSNKYDYSSVVYVNNRVKVKIICKKHGEFLQSPKDHMRGRGCSLCNTSKGESMVEEILKSLGISYIREHKFEGCVSTNGIKLPFDFYLPKYEIAIEYDGKQHHEVVEKFGGYESHRSLVKNDSIKDQWCKDNGIKLVRIKWNNVESDIKCLFELLSKNESSIKIEANYLEKTRFDLSKFLSTRDEFINFISSSYMGDIIYNFEIEEGYVCDVFLPKEGIGFNLLGLFKNCDLNVKWNNQLTILKKFNSNGYKMVQIFEDQWVNKGDIIKSRISQLIGNSNKIWARKCKIDEINDNKLIRDFLESNHIGGFIGSGVKLGLFHNGELVSLMTFGNLRKSLGQKSEEGHWELIRFCNKKNTSVIGGASKLFKYFIKKYQPSYITSYADKMWSDNNNMYEKIGMTFIRETKPSYFYIVGGMRKNRFNYRKDKLLTFGFDKSLSEYEICKMCGIRRIYDCGTIKYDWYK